MTGLLVLVGLLTGLVAALVWHFAVPPGAGPLAVDAWGEPQRPSWLPSLPLLSALGMLVGWFVAACANAEGWRIVRAPDGGRGALVALVGGTALVAGMCFAWAWTTLPPAAPTGGAIEIEVEFGETPTNTAGLGTPFCGDPGMMCVYAPAEPATAESLTTEVAAVGADEGPPSPVRLGIGSPWLTFPALCALVATITALSALGSGARVVRWTRGRR